MAERRKDRPSILPVYGGGEVLLRETPSGQFLLDPFLIVEGIWEDSLSK